MAQPGDVVITAKEVFDKLSILERKVDKLSAKFDALEEKSDDHESRIRSLERKVWTAMGGGGVLGAVAGWIVAIVTGG